MNAITTMTNSQIADALADKFNTLPVSKRTEKSLQIGVYKLCGKYFPLVDVDKITAMVHRRCFPSS
jgi:hypothetical protein